jgi:hypothetical protein
VIKESPYRSSSKIRKRLEKESCELREVSKVMYLQNNFRPTQNKTIYEDLSLKTKEESARNLSVLKLQQYGNIYQQ